MGTLPIRLWPDPVLRAPCAPVTRFDAGLARLAADMLETMYAAPGRGLAGPQVGEGLRIFVTDTGWKEGGPCPMVFVNPEVRRVSEARATRIEGCLSLPDAPAPVERPAEVDLVWQGLDGAWHEARFEGFAAACVQHELDHLNGVLILDHLPEDQRAALEARLAGAGAG